jgi:iron complex outermembrane receptor protein
VAFNYGGLINTHQTNELEEYQIAPSLTAQLGGGWQLRALASIGESSTKIFQQLPDAGSQAAAVAAGTLNPYNPGAASPSTLATIFRNFVGTGTQQQKNARLILDGGLFTLPGGSVRLAVGAEYLRESLNDVVFGQFVPGTEGNATPINGSRNVKSLFGELVVPIVGQGNAFGGVRRLTLSASGRYDHYSDFGGTFNPKIGLTFEPVEGVTLRGNWGKSFNAPSLADTNAPDTRSFSLPAFLALAPGVPPATAAQQLVVLVGGNPNLGPQKATTWSIGADIDVPFVPGLRASATYYNIHLRDQIAFNTQFYTPASANFYILAPTREQVEAGIAQAQPYLGASLDTLYSPGFGGVYSLLDFRRNNLAEVKQAGIDFNITYQQNTSFGSINAGVSGTYTLHRKIATISGGTFTDALKNPGDSELLVATTLGATIGDFKASATWKHTNGYDLGTPLTTARFGTQDHVGSFNTVDLFFQYDVNGEELFKDLSFTLNVENAFDEDPPFYNSTGGVGLFPGFTNGSTLGRTFLLGVRKKF